jgi:hypothetical protein
MGVGVWSSRTVSPFVLAETIEPGRSFSKCPLLAFAAEWESCRLVAVCRYWEASSFWLG